MLKNDVYLRLKLFILQFLVLGSVLNIKINSNCLLIPVFRPLMLFFNSTHELRFLLNLGFIPHKVGRYVLKLLLQIRCLSIRLAHLHGFHKYFWWLHSCCYVCSLFIGFILTRYDFLDYETVSGVHISETFMRYKFYNWTGFKIHFLQMFTQTILVFWIPVHHLLIFSNLLFLASI